MTDAIGPVLFTLFIWWFSTGLILYLDRLPPSTFRWSMLGATLVLGAGVVGLAYSSASATILGAYAAFASAIAIWAWHECSFLMGILTGPRVQACPPGCTGRRRFGFAVQSILHHELALLATAIVVLAMTAGAENQVGLWTFMVLWSMRISTKINLFLGVPNIGEEFLPDHLRYIGSYFARKPMNLFFPFSVTLATACLAFALRDLAIPGLGDFKTVGLTFVVTLLALAVIEHWFLVAPLPVAALWSWSLRTRRDPLPASIEEPRLIEKPARVARLASQPKCVGRRP